MATTSIKNADPDTVGAIAEHPPNVANPSNRIVPDSVRRRFLRINDRYFFPDRTLAFIDKGARLKVTSNNLEVVHSVVAIMQARGWRSVQLTGTDEFRQKVWHEATLQGIGVRGYQPDATAMQQLQRALDREETQRTRQTQPPPHDAAAAARTDSAPSPEDRRPLRSGQRPPTVGILLAHAAAPYQFDPMQRLSYYVRVQTEVGERTLWGTDLERALAESRSGAQVGDEVVLTRRGARPVTVLVPERNPEGELVGDKKLVAQRMGWSIEKTKYARALERKADLVRDATMAASIVLSQYPDLSGAMVSLKLAEQFARRLTPRENDQARVVQAIRTGLAEAVAHGQQVKMPVQRPRPSPAHHRGRGSPVMDDPGHDRA